MDAINNVLINGIKADILEAVPVSEIYLFGSFATGNANKNSDYDFYVVIPDDSGMREIEANWAIQKKLRERRTTAIDMLVGTQSKFDRRKEMFYSIENEVALTGVKLYG